MPGSFSFESDSLQSVLDSGTVLSQTILSSGAGSGVNNSNRFSAIAKGSINANNDIDVFAIHIVAGQRFEFDIDDGAGDSSPIDLQLDVINSRGQLMVSSDDAGSLDSGSVSTLDPLATFTATETGTYYVAVHQFQNDYLDNSFGFSTAGAGVGDYRLVVSTSPQVPSKSLTEGADTKNTSDAAQTIAALGGNDVLTLNGGNDIASGGDGNDRLIGGDGDDILEGDRGHDRLEGGDDDDALYGGRNNDKLFGGDGNDSLSGGSGIDLLRGDNGNDVLLGGEGDDTLEGGVGDDYLSGGIGIDDMTGGSGADTFHFLLTPINEAEFNQFVGDGITDFSGSGLSDDVIDLSDVFSGTLVYRAYAAFTGTQAEVRIRDLRDPGTGSGMQQVQIDVNGDAVADMGIVVDYQGSFNFQAADFIL